MNICTVIFDLDGTLLDTTEGVLESIMYTAKKLKFDDLPHELLLKCIGPPIQSSFIKHYGCGIEQARRATKIFREYYKKEALFKAVPYDGIYNLCQYLFINGYRMAIATYKREDYALKLLEKFHFNQYFSVIHGADNESILTKVDIINMCIDELEADRDQCVLIGDTEHDALGAEKSQINFIGVTYGFGFHSTSEVYKYKNIGTASFPLEILKFIDSNYHSYHINC